jgi:DNA-binding transcriptional regulator YhcF (GntR family)
MKEILLRKSDELSGACRNYFEKLKIHIAENNITTFNNRTMGVAFRIAHSTVKRYHYDLHNAGLIKLNTEQKTKTFNYQVISTEEYQQLQQKINNALDEVLEKIIASGAATKKPLTSLNQPTNTIEPINPNDTKPKKQQPSKNKKENGDQNSGEAPQPNNDNNNNNL